MGLEAVSEKSKRTIIVLLVIFTVLFMFYNPYKLIERISIAVTTVLILIHAYITIKSLVEWIESNKK